MPRVGAGPATTRCSPRCLSVSFSTGVRRKAAALKRRGRRRGSQGRHEGAGMPGCQRCQLSGWNRAVGRYRLKGEKWADGSGPTAYSVTWFGDVPPSHREPTGAEDKSTRQVERQKSCQRLGWLFFSPPLLSARVICSGGWYHQRYWSSGSARERKEGEEQLFSLGSVST